MRLRFSNLALVLFSAFFLLSCTDDNDVDPNPGSTLTPADFSYVHFDPTAGDPSQIPLPNDLLRNPATGQNAVPPTGSPTIDGLTAQFNTISGFSTTAPIVIPFVGSLNADTVNASTVMVVDLVAVQTGDLASAFKPVSISVVPGAAGDTVSMMPVIPLKPGRPHMVIVTEGVQNPAGRPVQSEAITILIKRQVPLVDASGNSLVSSLSNEQAASLEQLRLAYAPLWEAAESITGQPRHEIPFAFNFTTQPLYSTLTALRERTQSENPTPTISAAFVGTEQVDFFFNQVVGAPFVPHENIGAIYLGTFNAPNYINDPLNGFFQGSGENVVEVSRADLPFIAVLPQSEQPVPAIIFQHGITRFKEDIFAMADGSCSVGAGVIGIDLYLHGARTFGIDVLNNETGAPGPDGVADASGAHFINLVNLLGSRDHLRQSSADLSVLTRMIATGAADFDSDGVPEFIPQAITFAGQSLGSLAGGPFLAVEPNVTHAGLNVPGGRIPYLLAGSNSFGPRINAGLSAAGIEPGTFLYNLYLIVAQTIVDDGDILNYMPHMSTGSLSGGVATRFLIQEMRDDSVIPNFATEDLVRASGVTQIDAIVPLAGVPQAESPTAGSGYYQFEGAAHGSWLDPSSNAALTVAQQVQMNVYNLSGFVQAEPSIVNPFTFGAKDAPKIKPAHGFEFEITPMGFGFNP